MDGDRNLRAACLRRGHVMCTGDTGLGGGGRVALAFLLGRSGSMSSIKDGVIGDFNAFVVGQQQSAAGKFKMTLVQFDSNDHAGVVFEGRDVREVPLLTRATFMPCGGGAAPHELMYALGQRIARVEAAEHFWEYPRGCRHARGWREEHESRTYTAYDLSPRRA